MSSDFWRRDVFKVIMVGCLVFIVLTVIAMFSYPGGTMTDENTQGYSFFGNFFSELGMLHTHAGGPKPVSFLLFVIAMVLVSLGMVLFFLSIPGFYRRTRTGRILGAVGSVLGIASALFFVGVAVFPLDVNLPMHALMVVWAFRLFPAAVLCYVVVLFKEKGISYIWGWELVAFLLFLIAYILLLELGPGTGSLAGMIIQSVGQKIIVYASCISVLLQSWGLLRM